MYTRYDIHTVTPEVVALSELHASLMKGGIPRNGCILDFSCIGTYSIEEINNRISKYVVGTRSCKVKRLPPPVIVLKQKRKLELTSCNNNVGLLKEVIEEIYTSCHMCKNGYFLSHVQGWLLPVTYARMATSCHMCKDGY